MYIVHNSTGTQKNKTYTAYVQNTVYTVHIIRQKPRRILYTYTRMCIYIYIYIYMCVCMCICIYIYTYIHTYVYIYIYMCVCVCMCIYIYIFFFFQNTVRTVYVIRQELRIRYIYLVIYLLTYSMEQSPS